MQVWREGNDHCHVATYLCMTAWFPVNAGELYFQRQRRSYQQAIAKALFIGNASEHYFRITVVSITQCTAEIAVHFKVQVPDVNAPSDAASLALAAPVLGKMTAHDINFELTIRGLVKAFNITGADICNMSSLQAHWWRGAHSGLHGRLADICMTNTAAARCASLLPHLKLAERGKICY